MSDFSYERATGVLGQSNPTTDEFLFSIPDVDFLSDVQYKVLTDNVGYQPFSFETEEFPISANSMEYVTNVDYGTVSLQILENVSHDVLSFLISWRDLAYDDEKGLVRPPAEYQRTGLLERLNTNSGGNTADKQVETTLESIFPITVNDINHEYEDPEPIFYEIDFSVERIVHEINT